MSIDKLKQALQSPYSIQSLNTPDIEAAIAEAEQLQARVAELEAVCENVPEGCTPADARVLREANHALAAEVGRLREQIALHQTVRERLTEFRQAAEQERDGLADEVERLRNDAMRTEHENALLIAALKKEQDSVDGLNGRIVRLASRVAELEAEKWNAQIAEGALASVEQERDELLRRVAVLNSICGRFSNVAYNVHQVDRPLKEHEKQSLKDLQVEYDALQRANQIEGGES